MSAYMGLHVPMSLHLQQASGKLLLFIYLFIYLFLG